MRFVWPVHLELRSKFHQNL